MDNTRNEELKKLLISTDFAAASYEALPMRELIILKKSAELSKGKNLQEPKAVLFFTKRAEFFHMLILQRLQKAEAIYVLYAQATSLPYAYCDPDSCSDQVWIFSEEAFAKNAADVRQKETQMKFLTVKLENKQFLPFYISLYTMGVNELLIDRGVNSLAISLESLVKKPDYSRLPPEKQPLQNPELMLTAIYFAQNRALPKESQDAEALRELEEEMLANLQRHKILLPVQVPEGSEQKVAVKDMKFPLLKLPNGDAYQPAFTDPGELQKFSAGSNLRAITVDGEKLPGLIARNAKGIFLNPSSIRLVIPREKL